MESAPSVCQQTLDLGSGESVHFTLRADFTWDGSHFCSMRRCTVGTSSLATASRSMPFRHPRPHLREAIDGGERVSNGPHLLSGWKEIANYMHQGVRTVQRWELIGLPVRRVNTGRRSPVIALTEDLDAWARSLHVPLLDRIEELRATISSLESQIRSLKRQLRARNLPADMESAQTSNVTENESKSNAEEVSLSLD